MRLAYSEGDPKSAHPARGPGPLHRAVFEFGPGACLVTDLGGSILEANQAASHLLNQSIRVLRERPLAELVERRQRRGLLALLDELRFGRRSPVDRPLRLRVLGRVLDLAAAVARVPVPGGDSLLAWWLRDRSELKRAEARLGRALARCRSLRMAWRERARSLTARCLEAREEEARRIAHALHDEAGQVTASAAFVLHELEPDLPVRLRARVRQAISLVRDVEERLRRISHELRPTLLDDLGFAPALGFLADSFSARTGIVVDVRDEIGDRRLHAVGEAALYRVAQEALANVARHAGARRVFMELRHRKGAFRYAVRDDGVGFNPAHACRKGGLGLIGMRERLEALGGSLAVRSARGQGTELVAMLPAGG